MLEWILSEAFLLLSTVLGTWESNQDTAHSSWGSALRILVGEKTVKQCITKH